MCNFSPAIVQIPRTLTHHNQIGYQTKAHWSEPGEMFDLKCLSIHEEEGRMKKEDGRRNIEEGIRQKEE